MTGIIMTPAAAYKAILAGTAPDNLTVNGGFGIYDCPALTALPDGMTVNGWLGVHGCPALPPLYTDARGYELRRVVLSDGEWFIAGCRKFRRAEAIAHWGSRAYRDQERGAAFVAAINATGDA